ncbi:MAG: hypothetical protein E7370_00990 [Clostridiales bacterium]|nr:hypothetical protein [Clostridiales bacterium]
MTKKQIKKNYALQIKQLAQNFKLQKNQARENYQNDLNEFYAANGKKAVVDPPKRSVLEEVGNAVTHGLGSIFSVFALILMLMRAENTIEVVGACVYFAGLFIMFTVSCLYHSFRHGSAVKRLFRRFDYSCIYLLIGATFAPILLCYVGGTFGTTFFIVQWSIIATGVTFVAVFGPSKLKALHLALYLLLGWSGLLFIPQMLPQDWVFFAFILGGGIIYSIGVIPYALKKRASHFIWHFFVLAGAVVQWIGVLVSIYA